MLHYLIQQLAHSSTSPDKLFCFSTIGFFADNSESDLEMWKSEKVMTFVGAVFGDTVFLENEKHQRNKASNNMEYFFIVMLFNSF